MQLRRRRAQFFLLKEQDEDEERLVINFFCYCCCCNYTQNFLRKKPFPFILCSFLSLSLSLSLFVPSSICLSVSTMLSLSLVFLSVLSLSNCCVTRRDSASSFRDPLPFLLGYYWAHQSSWSLTPANSMKISIMQSDR